MRSERGSATIWMLGLSLLLLVFGGLAIDFWRALAVQRELAAVADSAAVAAASGIDEAVYRETGTVVLDLDRSEELGLAYIQTQDVDLVEIEVVPQPDGSLVSVRLVGELELGLMRVFVDQSEPLTIQATASAIPVLVP
jgi:Putative Flp pilus-assembly TadE/G-like